MKIVGTGLGAAFALAFWAISPGHAAQQIGGAVSIQREVSGQVEGRSRSLATGDDVHQNETIRTGNASSAELGFLDQTRLAVGASAAVKLDRFVFDPDRGRGRSCSRRRRASPASSPAPGLRRSI